MTNKYAEAIDILGFDKNIDYQRIAINLAKQHPTLFIRLYNDEAKPQKQKQLLTDATVKAIRDALGAGARILAIKTLREGSVSKRSPTCLSLLDAHEIITAVVEGITRFSNDKSKAYYTEILGN